MSDNFKKNFSARMADGREFTDYRSSCYLDNNENNMTTYLYRQYLTNNAEKIMLNNTRNADVSRSNNNSIIPDYKYENTCNKNSCNITMKNKNGIGFYNNNN